MLFKRCRMWEKRKIGRTENIGTREKERERKREARKGERQTFIPGQTADDSSNKRLLVAKGWIGGRWLFRGSPGLNPHWRVLDTVPSLPLTLFCQSYLLNDDYVHLVDKLWIVFSSCNCIESRDTIFLPIEITSFFNAESIKKTRKKNCDEINMRKYYNDLCCPTA